MRRLWPKRRWLQLVVVVLILTLGPYLASRFTSPWRCVAVHTRTPSADSLPSRDSLRIACYNIAHGRGLSQSNWDEGSHADRLHRLDRIAKLLRKMDADVVVLNEVDFDASWSHSINQAEYLAEKAGFAYWIEQRNLDFRLLLWKWRFGNAILSRYPVKHVRLVDLPGYSTFESILAGKKRGVSCEISVGDISFTLMAAHLSHRSEAVRVESARQLVLKASASKLPTVIAGDFNSTPTGFPGSKTDASGNNVIDLLDDSKLFDRRPMESPSESTDLTFHSAEPSIVIDWVLIPRDWAFLSYKVLNSQLSDHRPLIAEVSLAADDDPPVGSESAE